VKGMRRENNGFYNNGMDKIYKESPDSISLPSQILRGSKDVY
jgi:hypothetical protein